MGIFGDQAERLLRESWSGPDELAEELYAIFTDSAPLQIDSPVQIKTPQGSTVPPLSLDNNGINPAAISISSHPVGAPALPPIPDLPPLPGIGVPGLTLMYNDGGIESFDPPPDVPIPGTGTGASSVFPGMVTGGGPGAGPYQVNLFTTGLKGLATKVKATQLQIADDETIPPGTWALVALVGKSYYLQVPVWL